MKKVYLESIQKKKKINRHSLDIFLRLLIQLSEKSLVRSVQCLNCRTSCVDDKPPGRYFNFFNGDWPMKFDRTAVDAVGRAVRQPGSRK